MFDPKTGEYNEFHVADHCGERTCNKPAKFRSRTYDGTELWLCAECFDEFESLYGIGSFEDDDVTEPAGVYTTEVYEEDENDRSE
jgi:hypothetical protein